MPNWVYSNLTITDPTGTHEDRITSLVEQVGATHLIKQSFWDADTKTTKHEHVERTVPFSFWNIVHPEGEDLVKYDESMGGSGLTPFWYDWHNRYWGTKWDAGEASMNQVSPTEVRYFFETAWSPPIPVIATLSAQYPDLHIELQWEEEQGFGGTFVFTNGEAEETDAYDIPNSHADHVARDKNCPCEDWGPEDSFPDCPSRVENAEGMSSFSENELEIEVLT